MKCSSDYDFVIFNKSLNLQSIGQVLGSTEHLRARARIHQTRRGALTGELRIAVNTSDNGYRVGHGMIGTVLIAFDGDPLTIFVLIAR
jgi:hypothetical protein